MNMIHRKRIIPVLLLHNGGLVKSKRFKNYTYVGDPINAVRIFNEKEVDEIIILDIDASKKGYDPNYEVIADITGEAFMPLAYGGGIKDIAQAEKLFFNGIEKVVLNSILHQKNDGWDLVKNISNQYGNQSVVAAIDIKNSLFGKPQIYNHASNKSLNIPIIDFAKRCEEVGAGEIIITSVQRDGMYSGYDIQILEKVAHAVSIPVIVCGGAGSEVDFQKAELAGASACAAGSMFVFKRPHNAVLISYI